MIGINRDITEQDRLKRTLEKNEAVLRLATSAAKMGVFERNLETGEAFWSPEMLAILGLDPDTKPTPFKTFPDFVHPDDREKVVTEFTRCIYRSDSDGLFTFVIRILWPDNGIHWVRLKGGVDFRGDGIEHRPVAIRGVAIDVTEHKELEMSLRESETRFRELADAAPVMIWMADADMQCTYLNKGWLDFTGGSLALEAGKGWTHGIHPEDAESCLQDYSSAFADHKIFSKEYRLKHHSGIYRWVLNTGVPRFDSTDTFLGYVGACIDIDKIKQAQAEQETARLAAEVATQAKSDFLANMSHEIRTPLNGVLGLAQIGYRDSIGRDKTQETFAQILDSGKLLLTIINDILDFSKIEAGKLVIESIPFEPSRLVVIITEQMLPLATKKHLLLHYEVSVTPAACLGDPIRISQVLLNLISNALKFTETGEVKLKVGSENEELVFEVSDTGIGIPAETLERLFQPFEQAETSTTRRYGGTGLGLVISRRLAELMGGSLTVESTPGVGSRFTLRIPLQATAQLTKDSVKNNFPKSPALRQSPVIPAG